MKTQLVKPKGKLIINIIEDTQYVLDLSGCINGDPCSVEMIFVKEGVTGELLGIYNIFAGHKINLTTVTRHSAPNTSCMTSIKGVLNEGASSNYVGKILIEKSAQQTSSFLQDSILVTGERTHNTSQPILEIEADDVKASHGATTGRVSEDQVYYLMSRGLSRNESENIIIEGFFESLLSKISDPKVREKIKSKIKSKK